MTLGHQGLGEAQDTSFPACVFSWTPYPTLGELGYRQLGRRQEDLALPSVRLTFLTLGGCWPTPALQGQTSSGLRVWTVDQWPWLWSQPLHCPRQIAAVLSASVSPLLK